MSTYASTTARRIRTQKRGDHRAVVPGKVSSPCRKGKCSECAVASCSCDCGHGIKPAK